MNKQAQKHYEQAGKYLSLNSFQKAAEELKLALKQDGKFKAAYQQLGDISRKLKNHKEAIQYYQQLIALDPEFNALTYFGLAESEMHVADYASALKHFTKYLSFDRLTENGKKKAAKYISDCKFSIEAVKKPVDFRPVNLGPSVNTASQEYLPVLTADEERIIFTRRVSNNEDFYESVKDGKDWTPAVYLSSNINTPTHNEGAQCISPDGLYLFFTGCNRPDGLGRCDIYVCKREGKGWSEPFNLGPPVNTAGWESLPSLSADGKTLYFVSNRAGGIGGYDIWKSDLLTGGGWSQPVNLGPTINTEYDEHSPFIHPDNKTIYFSSNGWPGLGSKDIFVSQKDAQGQWQKPRNLGYPINTAGEESGLTVSADGKTAFFASDINGGYGGMDLYSFTLPEAVRPEPVTYVKGKIFDAGNKEVLSALVKITDLKNNEVVFEEESLEETGEFLATMPLGKNYGLAVHREGYLFYTENFSLEEARLKSEPGGKHYNLSISLEKIKPGGSVVLKNIFFETNKWSLMPESHSELHLLLNFMKDNRAAVIEIEGHTDDIGSEEANQLLSEERAKTIYNFLIDNKIDMNRLSFKGFGESRPAASNSTEEGRRTNRRTEFRILKY